MIWSPGRALVACLAIVLGGLRFARPRTIGMGGFKVPQHWAAFGDAPYMALFGFFLGMGLVTTVPCTGSIIRAARITIVFVSCAFRERVARRRNRTRFMEGDFIS